MYIQNNTGTLIFDSTKKILSPYFYIRLSDKYETLEGLAANIPLEIKPNNNTNPNIRTSQSRVWMSSRQPARSRRSSGEIKMRARIGRLRGCEGESFCIRVRFKGPENWGIWDKSKGGEFPWSRSVIIYISRLGRVPRAGCGAPLRWAGL